MARRITPQQALAALDKGIAYTVRAWTAEVRAVRSGVTSITGQASRQIAANWNARAAKNFDTVRGFINQQGQPA